MLRSTLKDEKFKIINLGRLYIPGIFYAPWLLALADHMKERKFARGIFILGVKMPYIEQIPYSKCGKSLWNANLYIKPTTKFHVPNVGGTRFPMMAKRRRFC